MENQFKGIRENRDFGIGARLRLAGFEAASQAGKRGLTEMPRVDLGLRDTEQASVSMIREEGKRNFTQFLGDLVIDLHVKQRLSTRGAAEKLDYEIAKAGFQLQAESWREAELIDDGTLKRFEKALERHEMSLIEEPTEVTIIKSKRKIF